MYEHPTFTHGKYHPSDAHTGSGRLQFLSKKRGKIAEDDKFSFLKIYTERLKCAEFGLMNKLKLSSPGS